MQNGLTAGGRLSRTEWDAAERGVSRRRGNDDRRDSVCTCAFAVGIDLNRPKKKVRFLRTGPPRLPPAW